MFKFRMAGKDFSSTQSRKRNIVKCPGLSLCLFTILGLAGYDVVVGLYASDSVLFALPTQCQSIKAYFTTPHTFPNRVIAVRSTLPTVVIRP